MPVSMDASDMQTVGAAARLESHSLRAIVLCALVIALDGFDAQSIAYVAPSITSDWGLKPAAFGTVFSSGLLGLTIGALLLSPLADRFGRKPLIVLSVFLFGSFSLLTASAHTLEQLTLYRLATGIGLGAAMPNLVALTSEHAPARIRSTLVMLMFCGFPLGSVVAGFAAAPLIASFGWSSVFIVGGILPLALVPVLVLALREPPAPERKDRRASLPVAELFTHGRAAMTMLLWLAFFMNLLVMYFLVNWLPSLLRGAGLSLMVAILSSTLLNLGGAAGAIVLGRFLDRHNPYWILGSVYASAALSIVLLASSGANAPLLLAAAALAGVGIVGSQIGLNALCAQLYPTSIRATGIGWALGIGRIGSIIGPLLGGVFLGWNWKMQMILLASAVPALIAAFAVFGLGFQRNAAGRSTI
jgi:AAHS family 4-hydroxybenzoate transporter-like MFS transporter